jgi:hypothetical protein
MLYLGFFFTIDFITKYKLLLLLFTIKAVAWAKPSRSQAMSGGFGLA